MPHRPVRGDVGILDPCREHRPHPADVLRRSGDRKPGVLERPQPREQVGERRGVEAGSDLAAVDELALDPLPERQRPEPTRRRRRGVARDHEVVRELRLALRPGLRPSALVGRRGALRDHALEPHPRHLRVEVLAPAPHVIAELHARPPARPGEEPRQQLLAPDQRHGREVPAVQPHQIEGEEDELAPRPARQRVLQQREAAHAVLVLHHDLAVDHRLAAGQRAERIGQIAVPVRPVEPAAGDQPHRAVVDERQRAIAVELDLVQPLVAGRRRLDRAGELRRDRLRPRSLHRPRERSRSQPPRLRRRFRGRRAAAPPVPRSAAPISRSPAARPGCRAPGPSPRSSAP